MVNKNLSEVRWEGEEYIARNHNTSWYIGFSLVCLALIALSIWLNWYSFLVLIILSAIVILIGIFRAPRKVSYLLDNKGLTEGETFHPYGDFRAFGILNEDGHFSAILIPKKRFGIQTKIYFPEVNGEAIVDMLGARLPMEEIKLDLIDKIVNLLRI